MSQAEAVESAPTALIDVRLSPVPEEFSATDEATWDGRRTLQGIWIAHPEAPTARRVRIVNAANGYAVDGALFRRDDSGSGPAVIVSSDAAAALGMRPGEPAPLEIVAIRRLTEAELAAAAASDGGAAAESGEPTAEEAARSADAPAADAADLADDGTAVPEAEAEPAVAEAEADPEAGAQAERGRAEDRASETALPADEAPETAAAADAGDAAEENVPADMTGTETEAAETALPAVGLAALDLGAAHAAEPADAGEAPGTDAAVEADAAEEAEPPQSAGATAPEIEPSPPAAPSPEPAASPAPPAASPEASDAPERASAPAEAAEAPAAPAIEDWPIERDSTTTRAAARAAPGGTDTAAEQAAEPETRLARTEPQATAPESPAEPLDRPFIQAGVFGVESNARRLIRAIEEAGYPAEGRPIGSGERQLTRVVAGPFRTASERDAALRRIREIGPSDALPVAR